MIKKITATQSGLLIKYGSAGRDLIIPAGHHYWEIDYGSWKDCYLTRREARQALAKYKGQGELCAAYLKH